MKEKVTTPRKPIRTLNIPDTLRERIEKRQEQIERTSERLKNLQALNNEALTGFLEARKIAKDVEVKFNRGDWSIEIFKKEKQ